MCRSRRELSNAHFFCKFWLRYSRERTLSSLPDRGPEHPSAARPGPRRPALSTARESRRRPRCWAALLGRFGSPVRNFWLGSFRNLCLVHPSINQVHIYIPLFSHKVFFFTNPSCFARLDIESITPSFSASINEIILSIPVDRHNLVQTNSEARSTAMTPQSAKCKSPNARDLETSSTKICVCTQISTEICV